MGIFKKSKDDSELEFDVVTSYEQEEETSEPEHHQHHTSSSSLRATIKQSYGIEDAIALMRKLPNVNSEITITVVKKTLESANIQVEEIISDAQRKESQIESRTKQLSTEINELQERIAHLNGEINELTSDLKETTKVKNLLIGASEQEKAQQKSTVDAAKDATKKVKEEPPAQSNAQTSTQTSTQPNTGTQPKEKAVLSDKA